MKMIQNQVILELTKKLANLFGPKARANIQVNLKDDKSFVTEIDLFVSTLLKEKLSHHPEYSSYAFFSEEDFKEYTFPCAILDPIDGTRELVKGRPECAVSLALMKSHTIADPENFAWLYNPFSGFFLDTTTPFVPSLDKSIQKLLTFVSRSEFHKGHYNKYLNHPQIDITPRGSIAFKLGLLAIGACDFIISLEPKNVWDIAAGTILCERRGIHFYENGLRIKTLDRERYQGALIWAPEELAPIILDCFKDEFKNEKS
ncbi:MAG: inositol monophosphatase family protein [Bacteriovorax sp.]